MFKQSCDQAGSQVEAVKQCIAADPTLVGGLIEHLFSSQTNRQTDKQIHVVYTRDNAA